MTRHYEHTWYQTVQPVKSVSIFSDGITSFYNKNDVAAEALSAPAILHDLAAYKNNISGFAERRLIKGTKDLAAQGIIHFDDVFCGAIIT